MKGRTALLLGFALSALALPVSAQTKASALLNIASCQAAYADWRGSEAAATADEDEKALALAKQAVENYDLCSDAKLTLIDLIRLRLLEAAAMEYAAAVNATDNPASGDYRVMLVEIESDLMFVCSSGYSAAALHAPNLDVPTYLDFGNLSVLPTSGTDSDVRAKLKSCSDALRNDTRWSP